MNYQMLRETITLRRKSVAFLAFLALLNVGLSLYLWLGQRPALEKVQGEWLAARQAQTGGVVAGNATVYRNDLHDLGVFRSKLIPKQEFPRLLDEMFHAAGANSLAIKTVAYKPTILKEPGIMAYGLSFSVVGRYAAVKSYLADLSRFPEMVTIDSLALSNGSPTQEAVDLKIQMTAYLKTEGA